MTRPVAALSLALLLTVAIANGISQAILGRSFFQMQLESRGIVLHEGPYRMVMKEIRVSDFMQPLVEGESDTLPEAERVANQSKDEIEGVVKKLNDEMKSTVDKLNVLVTELQKLQKEKLTECNFYFPAG